MTTPEPPTLDQLLNLIDRAEYKGGLTYDEGARLRAGLHHLTQAVVDTPEPNALADLRRRYDTLRKRVWLLEKRLRADTPAPDVLTDLRRELHSARNRAWRWKRRALALGASENDVMPAEEQGAAIRRVTLLAGRWTHIPAKRPAGLAVLNALTNKDET